MLRGYRGYQMRQKRVTGVTGVVIRFTSRVIRGIIDLLVFI
jgi:hypothetical protein